jgi:hypothetical protein
MSFEGKIALALRGSNWQQLQDTGPAVVEQLIVQESEDVDVQILADESELPNEPTEKQKKRMKRFEEAVARDTGDVLQTIEVDGISPVAWDITWEKEPELLCCYNWRAATDGSNTIYGRLSSSAVDLQSGLTNHSAW